MMEANPYHGTMSAVEEICRNLASVGARIDSLADCLCFGNPQRPEIMGQFKSSCEALRDAATFVDVPYVSGNVSLYNETAEGAIPPTPVLMGIGLVEDIRKCVTSDLKNKGDIWIVGKINKWVQVCITGHKGLIALMCLLLILIHSFLEWNNLLKL